MHRLHIYLPQKVLTTLRRRAKKEQISVSELIRRLLTLSLE